MKVLKCFVFFLTIFNFTNCISIKPRYRAIYTLDNGAIFEDLCYSTACKDGICPIDQYYNRHKQRYYKYKHKGFDECYNKTIAKKQKYFIENIEGITFYDGYIFEVPDGYKLEDIGLFKYTPIPTQNSKYFNTDGSTMVIPAKRLVKVENVEK